MSTPLCHHSPGTVQSADLRVLFCSSDILVFFFFDFFLFSCEEAVLAGECCTTIQSSSARGGASGSECPAYHIVIRERQTQSCPVDILLRGNWAPPRGNELLDNLHDSESYLLITHLNTFNSSCQQSQEVGAKALRAPTPLPIKMAKSNSE